jgi:succinate dehydrogenase / fumarate reductase membrane anchor subunit
VSAPTVPPPAAPADGGTPLQRRPRQSFETWSWFFMRISGLVLVFLALIHFSLTHIVNDVTDTDARFVAERWDNPLWRLFDWALLVLALLHGLNGLRWIIDDYVRSPAKRAVTKSVLYSVSFALLGYGTLTIVTFSA